MGTMASREKRQCLFTKYEFEIGVLTLPVYFTLLVIGIIILQTKTGQAFSALGIIGTVASTFSLVNGYKHIKW